MGRLNLKAGTHNEKLLLEHLESTASDNLVERINSGEKTLAQCWSYITSEARKQAVKGCACIEDTTVYGWAIHFFEEDSIKGEKIVETASVQEVQKVKEPEKKTKPAKLDEDQLSFDFL